MAPPPAAKDDTPKPERAAASEDGITVYFSPKGGCQEAIVEQLGRAKTNVKIAAYRLTAPPICKAILDAHRRGVKVELVLDRTQQSDKYSDATYFANAGLDVLIDHEHPIMHLKLMIIDDSTVLVGSYNFTAAAEANAETLLVVEDKPEISEAFAKAFSEHAAHAKPYKRLQPTDGAPRGDR